MPSRPTRPARIFVPPTSTPITFEATAATISCRGRRRGQARPVTWAPDGRRYHPPDAVRGEALQGLPRRPRQGEGPDAEAGAQRTARPAPPAPAEPALAAVDSGRDRPVPRARPRLGARELLPVPGRRLGGEQAARPARPPGARRAARRRDGHPPARHRPRAALRAGVGEPQRLDHARPRRHEPAPDRLPVDPARPAWSRSPGTATRRSTRRCSSAARRSPSRR